MIALEHIPDTTGKYDTVEALIRYAADAFAAAGVTFRPSKMSKFIRREMWSANATWARHMVDEYLGRELHHRTWAGFELYAASGYADPTGARAVANADRVMAGRERADRAKWRREHANRERGLL